MKFLIFYLLYQLNFINAANDVKLKLFTAINQTHPIYLNSSISKEELKGFCSNISCINFLVIHGYRASTNSKWVDELKNELFKVNTNINVFTIDWQSKGMYVNVIKKISDTTTEINQILYKFFDMNLISQSNITNLTNIHCIGHSLGAHVCGLSGKKIKSNLNLKFMRITGLDPAGPCFRNYGKNNKLDSTDADYVDVIHTSKVLGIQDPLGNSNYYPDGGEESCKASKSKTGRMLKFIMKKLLDLFPTCNTYEFDILNTNNDERPKRSINSWIKKKMDEYLCDHKQAYRYFIKSIALDKCSFIGKHCMDSNKAKCSTNIMGLQSKKELGTKIYQLNTNNTEPQQCNFHK